MPPPQSSPIAPLGREEYVEQAHFFGALAERLTENVPAQEVLQSVREEALATTKVPLAIDFMLTELRHAGGFSTAMAKLPHYFTPFQTFVVSEAENERGRFDLRVGLEVLRREAAYRTGDAPGAAPSRAGLFLYEFEALCRNRLGYDRGLAAIAGEPSFDQLWRDWVLSIRRKVGIVDISDLIYVHSEHYVNRSLGGRGPAGRSAGAETAGDAPADTGDAEVSATVVLFGDREGRIALANRRKDPLYLFSSLHRQLGYPEVPRPARQARGELPLPQIARRLEQLEKRLTLLEEEQRGGIDLTQFYVPPGEAPGG